MELKELYSLALNSVKKAVDIAKNFKDLSVDHYGDDTKLNLDKILDQHFKSDLSVSGIRIISEENDYDNLNNDKLYWIVDPLDGSLNYALNLPVWVFL